MAVAGLVCVLAFAPSRLQAQALDDRDVSFDQRFAIDSRIAPTFTRPEVIELLSSSSAWATVADEGAASAQITADEPDRPTPLGQIIMAEPKGPAKVLKDLLNTPVKELLVSRAEAGPEIPPAPATQDISPAGPQASGAPGDPGSVPARAADPLSERPPAQDVASMAASAPSQGEPSRPESAPSVERMAAAPQPSGVMATARDRERNAEPRSPSARQASTDGSTKDRALGTGRAAWYQHPGRTANGERFNPNQLTAAHRTLPFGTQVRVVNERTGRSVVVRINDRISRKALRRDAGLVIDLSRAGAKAIGLIGVGRVSLYQVQPGPKIALAEPETSQALARKHVATRIAAAPSRDLPRGRALARATSKAKVSQATRSAPQRVAMPAKTKAATGGSRSRRPPIVGYRLQGPKPEAPGPRLRS